MQLHDYNCKPGIKLKWKKDVATQWKMKPRKYTTNQQVKANFCLPEFSVTKIVMWECHVDDSSEIRYNMKGAQHLLMK